MKQLHKVVIDLLTMMMETQELTAEQMLDDDEQMDEFVEVFIEHFETMLHEQLITKDTFNEAKAIDDAGGMGVMNLYNAHLIKMKHIPNS